MDDKSNENKYKYFGLGYSPKLNYIFKQIGHQDLVK
jgi:hypothetical protein